MSVEFGLSIAPATDDMDQIRRLVGIADRAGLELIGIQDHPYQRRFLDTWMLMATVLAETERVRVFPDVANLPLRPPAVMAKAAASLDVLSGGRFELGLGAGGFPEAVGAMGGPVRSPKESVDALEEAIQVIRLMWSGERSVSFEGSHYRLSGLHPGPAPVHRIGIWVGALKPRMLRLVGRAADGWVPSLFRGVTIEELSESQKRIDDAAAAVDRDPSEIRRIYNVPGRISRRGGGENPLEGPADQWVETLTAWATEEGVDAFVFWPSAEPVAVQVQLFAEQIAPAVRAAVARG